MSIPPDQQLRAWARICLGQQRAAEIADSLDERAEYLRQVSDLALAITDEPATVFWPASNDCHGSAGRQS